MDSDDDIPTLPEDTLQLIAQFRQEQKRQEEAEQTGAGEISENWQLSQFWYTPETARALCQEATKALLEARGGGNVAVISAPTLLQYFGDVEAVKEKKINLRLFEYDDRFRIKYPDEYINFDYRSPLLLPEDLRNTFDLVIADPPFLSDECLVKTCQSVRLLGKQDVKIIFCTGAVMAELIERLLNCRPIAFHPQHANNLSNDFRCFTNYSPVHLPS